MIFPHPNVHQLWREVFPMETPRDLHRQVLRIMDFQGAWVRLAPDTEAQAPERGKIEG